MNELNSSNVLEFWENATVEQQIENIDKVLELINRENLLEMWKKTKKEVKCKNPQLIIRIIKEKLANGKMYTSGLWKNTPSEVQEQTIEQVMQLCTSELMIRKIWRETNEVIKRSNKQVLAKALKYDEKVLEQYDMLEYIPAPEGMLGKEEIDEIAFNLIMATPDEVVEATKLMSKIPDTSISYFLKQISEYIPENYIKMFWDSIKKDVQDKVIGVVLNALPSIELRKSIWNDAGPEQQKRKIQELLKGKRNLLSTLIRLTENQINKEIIEEIINPKQQHKNPLDEISSIWGYLPQEMQLEYFQKVMDIEGNSEFKEYIWQESGIDVQRINFQKMLQRSNNDIEQIIDIMQSSQLSRAEIIEQILQKYEGEQLEKIIKKYKLDVSALELLKGKISPDICKNILIKNASELSVEKLEELCKYFNIETITMLDKNSKLDPSQITPYDIQNYKKCRTVIDELLDGIDLSQNSEDPNREKVIFGEVIKRIANHISYDYETSEKIEKGENVSDDCANMVGGLLKNTCVCSGYAEIVRNVFSCCGIDVRYISGSNIITDGPGHAWNQIKLDGIWYNMDLTWDRDRIIAGDMTEYLLKSDGDFINHTKYNTYECKQEKCNETVTAQDMKWYLYKQVQIPQTIQGVVRKTRRRRVGEAYKMIAESQEVSAESLEKREEQWTN